MLTTDQRQYVLSSMEVLVAQAIVAWVDAKTLAQRLEGRADAAALAEQLQGLMQQAKDVEVVLREDGVPR